MDFMKKLILTFSTLASVSFSANAENAERLSATEWAQTWVQSWSTKPGAGFDTRSLEKKTLSACSECDLKESLKKARLQFARGEYNEAITTYNTIPRANAYWFSAVEEKGWAYFRQENYEKALAQTKTLLAPPFAEIVNSEAFLLQSLSQLKICDYKGVFETHNVFKEKQKARILAVQNLIQSGWNEDLALVIKKADKFPLTLDDMGDAVQKLPLLIYKDVEFQKQTLRLVASNAVITLIETKSKADSKYATLMKNIEQSKADSLLNLKKRIRELARNENEKNFKIIQKLNLVEVEAIQRIHTDIALPEELYKKGQFQEVSDDKLVFMDDGKPWIDELDKFEVSAKSCVKGIRRKM